MISTIISLLFCVAIVNGYQSINANTNYTFSINGTLVINYQINVPAGQQATLQWAQVTFQQGVYSVYQYRGWIMNSYNGNQKYVTWGFVTPSVPSWYYSPGHYSKLSDCPVMNQANTITFQFQIESYTYSYAPIDNYTINIDLSPVPVLTSQSPFFSNTFHNPTNDNTAANNNGYYAPYISIDTSTTGAGYYKIYAFYNDTTTSRWMVGATNNQCIEPTLSNSVAHGQSILIHASSPSPVWVRWSGYLINQTLLPPIQYTIGYCYYASTGSDCVVTLPTTGSPTSPSSSSSSSQQQSESTSVGEDSGASSIVFSYLFSLFCFVIVCLIN